MLIQFDPYIAKDYGILEAVIVQNLFFWIDHNKKNETHYYNDRYWTYNSIRAFTEQFPFASKGQIERALKNLEEKKVIVSGNFNSNARDRTKWYSLPDEVYDYLLGQKQEMHFLNLGNGFLENEKCINTIYTTIDSVTDINTDINILSRTTEKEPYADKVRDIIEYLNAKTGKHYSARSKATVDNIKARLREGFTVEDFKTAIDNKCLEWLGNPEMKKYLRPETLFRASHFDSYLNDVEDERQKRKREEQEINERQRQAIKDADIGIFDSV